MCLRHFVQSTGHVIEHFTLLEVAGKNLRAVMTSPQIPLKCHKYQGVDETHEQTFVLFGAWKAVIGYGEYS